MIAKQIEQDEILLGIDTIPQTKTVSLIVIGDQIYYDNSIKDITLDRYKIKTLNNLKKAKKMIIKIKGSINNKTIERILRFNKICGIRTAIIRD